MTTSRIISGYHCVNSIAYFISMVPFPEGITIEVFLRRQTAADVTVDRSCIADIRTEYAGLGILSRMGYGLDPEIWRAVIAIRTWR